MGTSGISKSACGVGDANKARGVVSLSLSTFAPMVNQLPGFTWILGSTNNSTIHLLAVVAFTASTLWLIARLAQRTIRNLPPGPRGLPLIGDVLHIADNEWLASPQRRDDYGNTPYLICLQRPTHVPFRRDDVYKRTWTGRVGDQQSTRCHRFT